MRTSALLAALLLAACPTSEPDPEPVTTFGNGFSVEEADGGWVLSRDGRRLVAGNAGTGPRVATFDLSYSGGFGGIWEFEEEGRVERTFGSLDDVTIVGDRATLTFSDGGDTASLVIRAVGPERVALTVSTDVAHDAIALPLACDDGASFHGFGEQYNGTDQRGEAFDLFLSEQGIGRDPASPSQPINGDEHTTYFPMPYFLDPRGVGFLMDGDARAVVDVCATGSDAWFESQQGGDLSGHVFSGPTGYDVIRQLSEVVGRPARPPSWAWEPWMALQGGRDDILVELDQLVAEEIPFSAVWVQDWTGIRTNLDGGFGVEYRWRADEALYPDLPNLIDDLHDDGIRFLSYANPFIDPDLDHWDAMADGGLLITDPDDGGPYTHVAPNLYSSHPDFTNPGTRPYVQGELTAMVQAGHDGWMADFGEWLPLDAVYSDGSDPIAAHNRFPLEWHRTWREVMDAERPDGDWAVISRSGWTGVQRFIQIMWVGDQEADFSPWDGLPTVVPAMLNLGLSGVPYVTGDIGGFSGGPRTKENWMRWTELGAFMPVMRTHEGNDKLDNWQWNSDAETVQHFRRFARVHAALAPELEALAAEAQTQARPMVRPLWLEFPDDPGSLGVSDQFLLGADLLVAPVVTEGASQREVVLPPGSWFHVWSGDEYTGPTTVTVDAPIGAPPVFARGTDRTDLREIQ